MSGASNNYRAMSASTFAVAAAIRKARALLRTEGKRLYESEPFVDYVPQSLQSLLLGHLGYHRAELEDPFQLRRGLYSRAQQVAYPYGRPSAMIDAIPASRNVLNRMDILWNLGSGAAEKLMLIASASLPFSSESEIYYSVALERSPMTFARANSLRLLECLPVMHSQ
jgi:hypothetical protein